MIELSPFLLTTLTLVAFVAGFISSIAGAGGLLTLPVLLWAGLPPINALATNKLQSSLGSLSSSWNFYRRGHVSPYEIRGSLCFALCGAILGTFTVQQIGNDTLMRLIPVLLVVIALYFLFSPRVADCNTSPRLNSKQFAIVAALPMGFYGGFFGPGMGSILPFLFVWLCGYNLRKATAQTKVMILLVNGSSALIFALRGDVLWELAFCMSVAQIIGARIGSNMVISRGTAVVQPLIVMVTLALAIKLLFFS
ncbi:MAG: TSUP family transporter [Porticoccaceae bacterium]|nr:TSUP family transporter [Porticoccaceae bacterium]